MSSAIRLSQRVRDLTPSPIREILAVIDRPGMISFAGGLPSPESFPRLDMGAVPRECLQYGPSEGEPALRERIAADLRALGLACGPEQVLVLSGSQQGIDLVGKLFIDRDTPVAVEAPTYLAALQVFRFFGARFVAFDPRDRDERPLAQPLPAFAYAIPTFQNPTGRCYSEAEREALARGVAFMPGEPFFPGPERAAGALRLNFSHAPQEQADRGLQILADLLRHSDASHAAPAIAPAVGRRQGSPVR